jgi:hypothetical protein
MKPLLFVAVVGVVLLPLFPAPASAQGLLYPAPGGSDDGKGTVCSTPQFRWSDNACWYVVGTFPPVLRLPQNGENATVIIGGNPAIFTLDMNTANLGSLNLASGNVGLTGTFLQPGFNVTAASESVPLSVLYQQNGGANNAGALTVTGTYNLQGAGSTLSAASESIDQITVDALITPGVFNQMDGKNTVSGTLTLGANAFLSGGLYNLSVGKLSADTEIIGDGGTGTFAQSSGDNIIASKLVLGNMQGASGTYNLVDGLLGVNLGCLAACGGSDAVIVGNGGKGTFTQTAGVVSIGGSLTIGLKTGSVGSYTQSGGTNSVNGNLNLGTDTSLICVTTGFGCSAGQGTYTLSGNGALTVGALSVGLDGTGEFDQKGGTNIGGRLVLSSGGMGTYNLSAGNLSISDREIIASSSSGIGIFNQTGGMNIVPTLVIGSSLNEPGRAVYNLSGNGTLSASVLNDGTFTYAGGTLNGNFVNQADGNFRIEGPGTRVINGTLANAGTVTVFAQEAKFFNVTLTSGVFKADPTAVEFQNLIVGAAGVVTGVAGDVFSITGNFQNLSTQNTLWDTSSSVLDFTGGGTHEFDLAGKSGAGFSNNFAWGTLALDPGNTLDLVLGSGNALYAFILQGLMISGNTITNIDGTPGLFLYYDAADNPSLNGNYNLTGGGELIAANGPAATPEPTTLLLFASGLGSLVARRSWLRSRA